LLFVPTLVIAEVAVLLAKRLGSREEATFLVSLARGELIVEHPTQDDLLRASELVWSYRDLPLGTVDASIVALAERMNVEAIATLDRRDFSVVGPDHVEAFELLP